MPLLLLLLFLWQLIFIVIVKDFDYCLKEKEMLGSNLPPINEISFFLFCFSIYIYFFACSAAPWILMPLMNKGVWGGGSFYFFVMSDKT